jgi:hypothetical protein
LIGTGRAGSLRNRTVKKACLFGAPVEQIYKEISRESKVCLLIGAGRARTIRSRNKESLPFYRCRSSRSSRKESSRKMESSKKESLPLIGAGRARVLGNR